MVGVDSPWSTLSAFAWEWEGRVVDRSSGENFPDPWTGTPHPSFLPSPSLNLFPSGGILVVVQTLALSGNKSRPNLFNTRKPSPPVFGSPLYFHKCRSLWVHDPPSKPVLVTPSPRPRRTGPDPNLLPEGESRPAEVVVSEFGLLPAGRGGCGRQLPVRV